MAPQELLGIVDSLGDHVAVSQETCRQKQSTKRRAQNEEQDNYDDEGKENETEEGKVSVLRRPPLETHHGSYEQSPTDDD